MPTPERGSITILISGPIAPSDLPGLDQRVCALLDGCDAAVAVCDVDGITADAVTVDALARLQLGADRHQCRARLLSLPRSHKSYGGMDCRASSLISEVKAFRS